MMRMIERVAMVLQETAHKLAIERHGSAAIRLNDDEARRLARSCIMAMREPTEAMLTAAVSAADKGGWADECRGCPGDMVQQFHRAMIDEALK